MLTTAGVTAFATSANPFDGAALPVRATGAATEVTGLDAWEEDTDWLPQIRGALSTATAMAHPRVRRTICLMMSSLRFITRDEGVSRRPISSTPYQSAMRGVLGRN